MAQETFLLKKVHDPIKGSPSSLTCEMLHGIPLTTDQSISKLKRLSIREVENYQDILEKV